MTVHVYTGGQVYPEPESLAPGGSRRCVTGAEHDALAARFDEHVQRQSGTHGIDAGPLNDRLVRIEARVAALEANAGREASVDDPGCPCEANLCQQLAAAAQPSPEGQPCKAALEAKDE